MSALQCRNSYEDDRVWRQHSSMIRQLYQEDKKTLKEVKEIMENEKGFPVTPLPVWEVKLRQLGMRKKLKKRDWPVVYQHLRPRLQQDGKRKVRKPTAVLINGTKKPLDDVWKEIKRNRALTQVYYPGHLPPLPPGVVIRTPSPEVHESTLRIPEAQSPESLLLILFQTTVVSFQLLLEPPWEPTAVPSETLVLADSAYRSCLEGIAFTRVLVILPHIVQCSLQSPDAPVNGIQHGQIIPSFGFSDNLADSWNPASWRARLAGIIACLPAPSESKIPNSQDLTLNFDSHHYLSLVFYLLSNRHLGSYSYKEREAKMVAIFELTFRFLSRRTLLAMFQSRLPSIRAAWEELLLWSAELENREAFSELIRVGMDNDWLEETVHGHEHLYNAVLNNCGHLINALLAKGCRPDSSFGRNQRNTAIVTALENGDLDCAKLLIRNCHVNRDMRSSFCFEIGTNFDLFIKQFDMTNEAHHHCLSFFLKQGADVDCAICSDGMFTGLSLSHCDLDDPPLSTFDYLTKDWSLSILDFVFYFRRQLFSRLEPFSKKPQVFSRSRALWCLEQGVHVLREYLQECVTFASLEEGFIEAHGKRTDVREYETGWLTLLLAEQFLFARHFSNRKVCCQTVLGLLELGADLNSLSTRTQLPDDILVATAELATSGVKQDAENGRVLMQNLLKQGFQVRADSLDSSLRSGGSTRLEWLATYCLDLKKYGVEALAFAVRQNNFEATKFLLDEGVDPSSVPESIQVRGATKTNIFGVAARESTLDMMKYVAQNGGKPWFEKPEGHPSDALVDMFQYPDHIPDGLAKVQYIIEAHIEVSQPFYPSAYLLDACLFQHGEPRERRRIFKFFVRQGARWTPGSPLASWIAAGGGHQLVREMLNAGADVNSYSSNIPQGEMMDHWRKRLTPLQAAAGIGDEVLVRWLLGRGADLNPPILARNGTTALREICAWDPVRPEERKRKDRILRLFLEKGTDVNAVTCIGETALYSAARLGDLPTALLLLKHGAEPSVLCYDFGRPQTALDAAAKYGRLDMVELLLNSNAVSQSASSDGKYYDGAIEKAREYGNFAIAELIRKHSADRKRDWTAAQEHATGTTTLEDVETQQPAMQSNLPTITDRYDAHLDGRGQACYNIASAMADSKASSLADAQSTNGTRTTGVGWNRAIEEIEDKSLPANSEREEVLGEDEDRATELGAGRCEASSGTGRKLDQPEVQVWDIHEGQDRRQPVPQSLSTDVFMGFSEFASP